MATTEEKQETIDALKGQRYFRIYLNGYGGEAAYINISKEAYDFWKPIVEEEGDSNLVSYMVNAEDGDLDDLDVIVPPEAMFMQEEVDGEVYAYPWYESPNEFVHQNGVEYGSARLVVEEVDSDEYMSNVIADVIDGEDLAEYLDSIMEANDYEFDLVEADEDFGDEGDYVLCAISGKKISLEKLTYWNVELQEPYFSYVEASFQRDKKN